MDNRPSILVVEDEHTLRRLLEYRLGKVYNVMTAGNGEEALFAIDKHVPDLIISDIMMPKMDGFALQHEVRARRDTKSLPFIFLTAKADEQSRLKGLRTGVDDYIPKPFDIEQLLARVQQLLDRVEALKNTLPNKIASDFSEMLKPRDLPEEKDYRVLYQIVERETGGGDMFYWTKSRDDAYLFAVADVMGKGIQAKFFANMFYGYIQTVINTSVRDIQSPAGIMARLNELLLRDPNMQNTHASMLIIRWEPSANRVTYANAGHCRPLLTGPGGSRIIEYSDMVVGLDRKAEFVDTEVILPENAAFVAYTDGLSEQLLDNGEMIGEAGVLAAAELAFSEEEPIDALLSTILSRSKSDEWRDDILVFWLQRTGLNWFTPFEVGQQ